MRLLELNVKSMNTSNDLVQTNFHLHGSIRTMLFVYVLSCLLGNCTADVEITLERPVCLEVYERCKPLGRFMLRVNGESIAGGTVTAVSIILLGSHCVCAVAVNCTFTRI